MQKLSVRHILFIFSYLILLSCSKSSPKDNRSAKLILLQNTWNFNSITLNSTIDGTQQGKLFPYQTTSEYNINGILYNKSTATSPDNKPYRLLSDDSTLIFTITDNTGIFYDTNRISSLTNNELVYHGFNREKTLFVIDSLTR